MKQILKKGFCILLTALLVFAPFGVSLQASASTEFAYPDGVSAEKAEQIINKTDTLLLRAVNKMTEKTLAENVMPMLYESNLLSSVTVGIYSALSAPEMAEMLNTLQIHITPADLSAVLFAYPQVSAALANTSDWSSADLSNVSWDIKGKTAFAAAFGTVLSPLHTFLQFLLCEGSFNIVGKLIKISGGNGYETAVIPLYNAFGCTDYISYGEFKAQAEANTQSIGANLILPLLDYIESILDAPIDNLCAAVPNLAYFINNDGFEKTIETLMIPVNELAAKLEKIPVLNSFLSDSAFSGLSEDFAGNLIPDMNTMLADTGIALPEIDWELLASCGTVSGDKVTANKGKTFIVVFRWLWEVLQNNADAMMNMLTAEKQPSAPGTEFDISAITDAFLQDDADTVLRALAFMLNPETQPSDLYWSYSEIQTSSFAFTQSMPRENYAKMTEGFDNLLGALLAESLGSTSLTQAVRGALYTNNNVTLVAKTVYGLLCGDQMQGIAALLDIECEIADFANSLTEEKYKTTVGILNRYATWEELPDDVVSWGFTDGDRDGFIDTCALVLQPLEPFLQFALAGKDFVLLDSITIRGGNGYNNAIIPLFEALGVPAETYKTFVQFSEDLSVSSMLSNILSPLLMHVENICESPVTYLTQQLPTIAYFISDGGLQKMLYGLSVPILEFIAGSGLSVDILSLIEEIAAFDLTFGEEQVNKLLSDMKSAEGETALAIPPVPALTTLASLGTLTEHESKRTWKGSKATYKTVEADTESVMAYLVDFIVSFMQMPENSNMLTGSFMGGSADGAENPFASYTDTFAAEMENMTHDDMIKWFYDMLVIEPTDAQDTDETEQEIPHIKYEPPKEDNNVTAVILVCFCVLAVAVTVIFVIRKKKSAVTKNKKTAGSEE